MLFELLSELWFIVTSKTGKCLKTVLGKGIPDEGELFSFQVLLKFGQLKGFKFWT